MTRGELYRVKQFSRSDPKKQRVFVVVSRQILIDVSFPTVICAPLYSRGHGFTTEVSVGIDEGLKHESSVHCDELVSVQKSVLTNYVGVLAPSKIKELDSALSVALGLE